MQKTGKSINTTKDEMDQFIGIQVKMCIVKMPRHQNYWANLSRFQIHTEGGEVLVKAKYAKESRKVKALSQREYITYPFKDLQQREHLALYA